MSQPKPSWKLLYRVTDESNALAADWLVRDLLPVSLRFVDLAEHADRCADLPPITADLLSRQGKLRRYATATRSASAAAKEAYWTAYEAAGRPPVPLPLTQDEVFGVGNPVTIESDRARTLFGASKTGYWAYRAAAACTDSVRNCRPAADVARYRELRSESRARLLRAYAVQPDARTII